jgi:hypothetical protein
VIHCVSAVERISPVTNRSCIPDRLLGGCLAIPCLSGQETTLQIIDIDPDQVLRLQRLSEWQLITSLSGDVGNGSLRPHTFGYESVAIKHSDHDFIFILLMHDDVVSVSRESSQANAYIGDRQWLGFYYPKFRNLRNRTSLASIQLS